MRIRVTFKDRETEKPAAIELFEIEVPAALWSFMGDYERKEYCVRSFLSTHNVQYEEVE